jgi:hypothetical protein
MLESKDRSQLIVASGALDEGTSALPGCCLGMRMKHSFVLSCAMMMTGDAALAQAPPTPATPPAQTAPDPAPRSTECAPTHPATPNGNVTPRGSTTGQAAEPLSDKLAKSGGVLCPPSGVDPEMRAPTPPTGDTPVIPPPGSPGGDPNVRPK